jgi:hypothetical protein
MVLDNRTLGVKIAIVGGVATIVGSVLPWVTIDSLMGSQTVSGLDGDGVLTLVCGIATLGVCVLRGGERIDRIALGILGVLTVLIGYNTFSQLSDYGSIAADASASPGLYVTMLAGAVIVSGAIQAQLATPKQTQPRQQTQY